MVVPEKYIKSRIGIIPKDWEVSTMAELTYMMTNGFVGTIKHHYVLPSVGVLYIQGYNVEENGYNLNDIRYVSKEFHNAHLKSELMEGDMLTIQTGDIGVTTQVPKEFAGANCHALIISRFKKQYDSKFWCYYFNSIGRKSLIEVETGSTMKHINVSDMQQIQVPVPPSRYEQTAIAEVLSDADSLITSLEKLLAKKKVVKLGTMQELLTGKKRLPGFCEKWKTNILSNVADVLRGGSPRPIQDYLTSSPNGINWIKIGDVTVGAKYIEKTEERIVFEGAERSRRVSAGDFLLSNSMSFGRPYILKIDGCIHDGWLVIQNYQKNFDLEFLFYYLCSETVINQYLNKAAGSSVLNLNKELVSSVELYYPEIEEQVAIASILSDMDAEIEQLEKKLAKYRLIKQGMMQELLTGRIRLIEVESKPQKAPKAHNEKYDDAIAISAIVNAFYDERFYLGRVKVQKLLYLLRRKQEADVSGFKKKAAGPYNEQVRYNGGESIAVKEGYVVRKSSKMGSTFSKGKSIETALQYAGSMQEDIEWLHQKFKYYNTNKETNNLEVLATVDMAVREIEMAGKAVTLDAVKNVIRSNKEWAPKLKKVFFTDAAIEQAINESKELFA